MPPERALDFVEYLMEQEQEQLLFQRWIAGPQEFMGFEEFKEKLNPPSPKPDAEVIADAEAILKAFHVGGEASGDI